MNEHLFQPPTEQQTLQGLFSLGYFEGKEWDEVRQFLFGAPQVQEAIDHYKHFHDLKDEDVGEHLLRPRCGLPDLVRRPEAAKCKWPMLDVTTSHKLSGLNPLSAEQEHRAWLEAIEAWNSVCGLRMTYIDQFDRANIYASPGSTGPGVLAYSYLPCGADPTDRMQQVYNRSTNWSYRLLVNVIIHEIGHAIGLDHGPRGSIMQPTAAGDITKPQSWDIQQVVERYGNPVPRPTPPLPQPPSGDYDLLVSKTLQPGKYRITVVQDTLDGNDPDDLYMG